MAQDRVRRQAEAAIKGLVADYADTDIVSRVNAYPQAVQIESVTVDGGPPNNTDFTIEIAHVTITYTSGGSASVDSVRDGLLAAVEDEPLVTGHVIPSASGNDTLLLTGRRPGESFSFVENDPNLSSSQTQAATEASPIPFGRAIMDDGLSTRQEITAQNAGSYSDGAQTAHLLDASELTARAVDVQVDTYDNAGTYTLAVEVAGTTYETEVSGSGPSNASDVAANLVSGINTELPAATVDATANGDLVELQAELAGLEFAVEYGVDESSSAAMSIDSDNESTLTSAVASLLGVSAYSTDYEYPRAGASGDSQITANEPFSVLKEGRIWVNSEDAVTEGDEVYVRLEAAGGNSDIGRFRASFDQGCVRLPEEVAKWVGQSGDLALLELQA